MSRRRKLTDAQVEAVRAVRAKRDELIAKAAASKTFAEEADYWQKIRALPTVEQQADELGVSFETVKRIRLGWYYIEPEPKCSTGNNSTGGTIVA